MNVADKILNLDKRVMIVCIFVGSIAVALYPLGFPVITQPWVNELYNEINSLESGDTVLIAWTISAERTDEIAGMKPLMKLLFQKEGVKSVHFNMGPQLEISDAIINEASPEKYGKEYGVDFIRLGYIAGGEAAVAAVASDLKGVVNVDRYGDPLDQYPFWNDLSGDMNDFDLVIAVHGGDPGMMAVRRQIQVPFGTRMLVVCNAGALTMSMPFFDTGQYVGMLLGMTDVAAFEILVKSPGIAARSTDVLSIMAVITIIFIVMANLAEIYNKLTGGQTK